MRMSETASPAPSAFDGGTVYIIDSYGLIYRAYFAFIARPLTYKGANISALFGFFRNLAALIKTHRPGRLVAAFDSKTPTFRHELYPEYKATRNKTPEDLHAQIPWIEETLSAMGVHVLQHDGFEADDIIATVVARCKAQGISCRILSGDKDLMQLVDSTTQILKPDKAGGWTECGAAEVTAEWGVPPEKLLDLLSLTGDTADNVPGIAGVGEKTAVKLLAQYGSLDGIYAAEDRLKGAMGDKIRGGKESAYFSRKLIALKADVPLDIDFDSLSTARLDYKKAASSLKKYGAAVPAKAFALLALASDAPETQEEPAEDSPLQQNAGAYRALLSVSELHDYIEEIRGLPDRTFAFDTETDSLNSLDCNLVGFSLSHTAGTGIYVPVTAGEELFAQGMDKAAALAELRTLLDDTGATAVLHNAKFDIEVLGFTPECRIADTMIAAWLLQPDTQGKSSYSLEGLAERRLHLKGTEFSELVGKGMTFADVPLEKAAAYSAEDADFTLQLWRLLEPELKEQRLDALFWDVEMRLLPVLAGMEKDGIHLDTPALTEYAAELRRSIASVQQEIYSLAGHEFNIASPQQLQVVLFDELKLPKGKKTKRGYSTDTAVLENLQYMHDVPRKILEFRGMTKLLSTYVETLPAMTDTDSRVHTSFIQTGTATGRLSSRDPNLQNIPVRDEAGRRIRSAFTAVPGTVLISADYAQIELVVLAHLSGDPALCRAFTDGTDVHRSTAALIFGVTPESVTPEMRRTAKTINFGVLYGMSAFRLANELGITRTQAQGFIKSYFETYGTMRAWLDSTVEQAKRDGFVETLLGRRRSIYGINSSNKMEQAAAERVAINTPVQGSAADIVKLAMLRVSGALAEKGTGARLLLQVHDELILECPDTADAIGRTVSMLQHEMEAAATLRVPLRVSVEHGKNWGEFH